MLGARRQRTGPPRRPASAAGRRFRRLLRVADRPLTADGVRDAREDDRSLWGLITVKRALSKLRKMRLVFNTHKPPRGYYLAERYTMFTSRAAGA
jgi:hypothetical protein